MFIATFLQHYYTFICYNLMGYVLLQYHDDIGFHVDYENFIANSFPEEELGPQDPQQARRQQVNVLIKIGRHEAALSLIDQNFSEHEDDIILSGKYLTLLKVCQKKEAYKRHGLYHLQLLVEKKKASKAIKVYQELTASAVRIPIDSSLAVAQWFFDRNEYQKAGKCYVRCINSHPKHPRLPEAYFRFIQLLHEQFGNTAKAVHLSKGVIQTWPKHPLANEVQSYMKAML